MDEKNGKKEEEERINTEKRQFPWPDYRALGYDMNGYLLEEKKEKKA